MKIDLSDPLKELDSLEKEYLDYLVSNIKLNEGELSGKFGARLDELRNNLELRRLSAEIKLSRQKRKSLVDNYKLEQFTQVMPTALKGLVEIAKNGKEHNKLAACMFLLRPAVAYLEKHGQQIAEIESIDGNEDKFNFTLNVKPIGS